MSPDYRNLHMSKQLPRKTKNESYNDLRYAIVVQAVKDYVWSREYVRDHKQEYKALCEELEGVKWEDVSEKKKRQKFTYEQAKYMIPECEAFFRGDWFRELCDYNGEEFIRRLRRTSWSALKKRLRNVKEEESC